jgi:hypothetical protein
MFDRLAVDEAFAKEALHVLMSGEHTVTLFDSLALSEGSPRRLFKALTPHAGERNAVYRGWMLTVNEYRLLEDVLRANDITLKTSVEQYVKAHHFPGWYEIFEAVTPKTYIWDLFGEQPLSDFCAQLPEKAYVVKDYVKSRKHEWDTACFAPNVGVLETVIGEFIRLQQEDNSFVGEVVVREFERFNSTAGEARVWWVDGEFVVSLPHPDNPEQLPEIPKDFLETVKAYVQELGCPFRVTDITSTVDGRWRVIEVGDAQVSGLPKDFTGYSLWKAL